MCFLTDLKQRRRQKLRNRGGCFFGKNYNRIHHIMVSERKKEVLYGPTRVSYTHHGHFLMFIFFVRLFPFILKQNKDSAHLRKGCFFFPSLK